MFHISSNAYRISYIYEIIFYFRKIMYLVYFEVERSVYRLSLIIISHVMYKFVSVFHYGIYKDC